MTDQSRSEIIKDDPIGTRLDFFRSSFDSICKDKGLACSPDALDLRNLVLILLSELQILPAARLLRSGSGKPFISEPSRLNIATTSDDFNYDRVSPLFAAVIANKPDEEIWTHVYHAVTESTPPPPPITSSLQQTPWLRNTGSFVNSSEHRKYVDNVLKEELGPLYVGLRNFHGKYFGGVTGLTAASRAVFDKCKEGKNSLFGEGGWSGWPQNANQDGVLSWFTTISDKLATLAEEYSPTPTCRRPLVRPNQPIQGFTAERKIDVGFVSNSKVIRGRKCHWLQMLIPGELKGNLSADTALKAWLDIRRYV